MDCRKLPGGPGKTERASPDGAVPTSQECLPSPMHLPHAGSERLTVSRHAHGEAFLQPAVLAAVSAGPIDQTVLLTRTGVGGIALLTSPEKALRFSCKYGTG